jgi:uncharacterized protein YidB (DUF937 family)
MANPILGSILAGVFANAMRGRARQGPYGAGGSGGLGDLLGGMVGRGRPVGRRGGLAGNRGMLLAMLLPFAMQWVQRNGGIGSVLERFRQKGYGNQANSWVSAGPNAEVPADAISNVVGSEELSRLSRQLGVAEDDVASGFAEILPEVTDQLSPEGNLPAEADEALDGGLAEVEKALNEMQTSITA